MQTKRIVVPTFRVSAQLARDQLFCGYISILKTCFENYSDPECFLL